MPRTSSANIPTNTILDKIADRAIRELIRWALTHNPVVNVPNSARNIGRERALEIAAWTTGVPLIAPKKPLTLEQELYPLRSSKLIQWTNVHNPQKTGETIICYVDYGMNPDDIGFSRRITELYNLLETNNRQIAQILVVPTPGYGGWQYMSTRESAKAVTGNRHALSKLILKQMLDASIIDYSTDLSFVGYSQGAAFALTLAQSMYELDKKLGPDANIGNRNCVCLDPPAMNKHNPMQQLLWLAIVEARQLEAYEGPGAKKSFIELIVDQIRQAGVAQSIAGLALVGSGLGYGGPRFETSDEITQLQEFAQAYNLKMGRAPNSSIFTEYAYNRARRSLGHHLHTLVDDKISHSHAVARNPYIIAAWIAACLSSRLQTPEVPVDSKAQGARVANSVYENMVTFALGIKRNT